MASRRLNWLLSALLAVPATAHAYPGLGLSLGYSKDCATGSDPTPCREGGRAELLLDLFGRSRQPEILASPKEVATGKTESGDSTGSSSCFHGNGGGGGNCGSGGGGGGAKGAGVALLVVLAVILIVIVAYGIAWAALALFSSDLSIGLYASSDYYPRANETADPSLAGQLSRFGIQASFWPVAKVPLRMHVGVGPSSWRVTARTGSGNPNDYRNGFSTKGGIGYAPNPGTSGPLLFYEAEYLTLYGNSVNDVIKQNLPENGSQSRVGNAVMAGYMRSW